MTPTIGELFAGYGGLGMGVQAALGGRLAWVSDIDDPATILAHRFPDVPNLGDVTAVDWTTVERPNILTGGSPCQDISNAGRMAGMTDGTRSNLWVAMRDAIAALRPDLVVWENVGGALNAAAASELEHCEGCVGTTTGVHLRALGRVLGDLASLGFDAEWTCVRASDVGAPHKRLRVFVVAWPSADPEGIRWTTWRNPARRTGPRSGPPGRPDLPLDVFPTPMANEGDKATLSMTATRRRETGRRPYLTHTVADLLPTPTAMDSHSSGGGYSANNVTLTDATARQGAHHVPSWANYQPAIERWESLTRPHPNPVELGARGNLRLSARFPEWMMGLPDGWVTDVPGLTRNAMLRAIGNGVVPQQAAYAVESLRRYVLA